jgi:hypothetical protein
MASQPMINRNSHEFRYGHGAPHAERERYKQRDASLFWTRFDRRSVRKDRAAVASRGGECCGRPLNERSAAYVQCCFGTSRCICDGSGTCLSRRRARSGPDAECVRCAAV